MNEHPEPVAVVLHYHDPDHVFDWCKVNLGTALLNLVAYASEEPRLYKITVTVETDSDAAMVRLFWDNRPA